MQRTLIVLGLCVIPFGCPADSEETEETLSAGTSDSDGGSCEGEVMAQDYDQSCQSNADCVAVYEGPVTGACRECGFAAINVAELPAYEDALGPDSCSEGPCAADCAFGHGDPVACVQGQCALMEPTADTFPCGDNGGSCATGTELCVVENDKGCSACVPLDSACTAADGCDCIADIDPTAWDTPCADEPICELSGDGLLVRCTADGWSCG